MRNHSERFVENRDAIKSAFRWESPYIYPLCASLYTAKDRDVDLAELEAARGLLKRNAGVFSNFRGTVRMVTATKLALSDDPGLKWEQLAHVYGELKDYFWGSEYLAVASMAIVEMAEPEGYADIVRRTRQLYERMKEAHPFLTSGEDSAFAALLAMSELDDFSIEQEMERCYGLLKPSFFSGNAVQALSQVLALSSRPSEEKCERVTALYGYLYQRGYKYGKGYELPTLGALALLEKDVDTLTGDIMEVDDFLKSQKGFGGFGIGAKQRLMYAGLLTMEDHAPAVETMQAAALKGVLSLVIAQQVAVLASVTAASAAAAAASSSSS